MTLDALRRLLGRPDLSDAEATRERAAVYALAQLMLDLPPPAGQRAKPPARQVTSPPGAGTLPPP